MKRNESQIVFAILSHIAKDHLEYRVGRDGAVFYAGPENRAAALDFVAQNPGTMTLEQKLAEQLLGRVLMSAITTPGIFALGPEQSGTLWDMVSARFADAASGLVNAFVEEAKNDATFVRVELQHLEQNEDVYFVQYR